MLLHPHLWDGSERTLRLQRFHLAAAVAIVVAFTGIHLLRAGWGSLDLLVRGRPRAVRHGWPRLIMAVCVVGVCANHPKDVDWSGAYGEPNLVDLLGQRLGPRFDKGIALAAVATLPAPPARAAGP